MKKRVREANLKTTNLQELTGYKFWDFVFNRRSFFRDYKLLHYTECDSVNEKINAILYSDERQELEREIRLCFDAALLTKRSTYYFNLYIIELVELYYSNLEFSLRKREIADEDILYESSPTISYEWVLFSDQLSKYQRYLLFEYLVLGYSIGELAKRRSVTPKTIYNHIDIILLELDS